MGWPSNQHFNSLLSAITSPPLREVALHWHGARGQRALPTWGDLSATVLAPNFKWLWGFHYDPESGDFTGRLAGNNIRDWLGSNFLGASLNQIHPPKVLEESRLILTQVVTTPAAGRFSGRLFTIGDQTIEGERICLPLAPDGKAGGGVLGASFYEYPPQSGTVELLHENAQW